MEIKYSRHWIDYWWLLVVSNISVSSIQFYGFSKTRNCTSVMKWMSLQSLTCFWCKISRFYKIEKRSEKSSRIISTNIVRMNIILKKTFIEYNVSS